jgi:hypothetical protein
MSLILPKLTGSTLYQAHCWANFQTHLEAEISQTSELNNGKDIETCVEEFSAAILGALAAFIPKRRLHGDQRPHIPAGIQDEIRLKTRDEDGGM